MEEQVHTQPWFVKAMGNPIVMGALGMIASEDAPAAKGCLELKSPRPGTALGLCGSRSPRAQLPPTAHRSAW